MARFIYRLTFEKNDDAVCQLSVLATKTTKSLPSLIELCGHRRMPAEIGAAWLPLLVCLHVSCVALSFPNTVLLDNSIPRALQKYFVYVKY